MDNIDGYECGKPPRIHGSDVAGAIVNVLERIGDEDSGIRIAMPTVRWGECGAAKCRSDGGKMLIEGLTSFGEPETPGDDLTDWEANGEPITEGGTSLEDVLP